MTGVLLALIYLALGSILELGPSLSKESRTQFQKQLDCMTESEQFNHWLLFGLYAGLRLIAWPIMLPIRWLSGEDEDEGRKVFAKEIDALTAKSGELVEQMKKAAQAGDTVTLELVMKELVEVRKEFEADYLREVRRVVESWSKK